MDRTANDTTVCYVWNTCDACGPISSTEDAAGLETGVAIYPNPTNGATNIEFGAEGVYQLTLYDISGKIIENTTVRGNRYVLDVNSISEGVYLLNITNEQDEAITRKLSVF